MEVLDTTIANVALPYIAGGMGVSEDEASWVVTTYLVSNAIVLTASSFLARMFGRKTFFLISLGLFTASSLLCGFAPNLNALLLFRILQGFGGGGMVPVAQSILAEFFPAGETRSSLRAVRRCRGGGAGGRADARRVGLRQLVLAVVLCDQCTGGRARDGTDRGAPARAQAAAVAAARPRVRRHRLHIGRDLPRCAGGRARPWPGGRLVRL